VFVVSYFPVLKISQPVKEFNMGFQKNRGDFWPPRRYRLLCAYGVCGATRARYATRCGACGAF